jgi:hypothetical protein
LPVSIQLKSVFRKVTIVNERRHILELYAVYSAERGSLDSAVDKATFFELDDWGVGV